MVHVCPSNLSKTTTAATLDAFMKKNFFDNPAVLRKYLFMALGEYSDPAAQAMEQKWFLEKDHTNADFQNIVEMMYNFPRPLTVDRFQYILETLELN